MTDKHQEGEVFEFTGETTPEGRPIYRNQHGEFVTERTITEYIPEAGGWFNIPTFYDGNLVDRDMAINMFNIGQGKDIITGREFSKFNNLEEAVAAAQGRSGGYLTGLMGMK